MYTYYKNDIGNRDWQKKLSSILHPLEKRLPSLQYGKDIETKAFDCYKQNNPGKTVFKMGLIIPLSVPYLGFSPDGIVSEDRKLIEIKCPVAGNYKPIRDVIESLKYIENREPDSF